MVISFTAKGGSITFAADHTIATATESVTPIIHTMSSRRPADDAAAGEPDSKRAKIESAPAKFDIATIRAQIAAKKAQAEAEKARNAPASRPAGPSSLPPPPTADASARERAAAAKARIDALAARNSNPYLSGSGSMPKADSERTYQPTLSSNIALHPLLMAETAAQKEEKNEKIAMRNRYKTMAPKFSTVRANVATVQKAEPVVAPQPSLNPYTSKTAVTEEAGPGRRSKRNLQFAAAGRFVKQGEAMRNEQKMEALRLRIMEKSRKAGLDGEFDTMGRSLKVSHCNVLANGSDCPLQMLSGGTGLLFQRVQLTTISTPP